MTQSEKLEALVRKAKIAPEKDFELMAGVTVANEVKDYCDWLIQRESEGLFLFNKNVARALFGEETILLPKKTYRVDGTRFENDVWMVTMDYHLHQSVISKDPIDYVYGAVFG